MAESDNLKPHAIFIPYPLQGHVIPSVELAIKLASRGFKITFVNTQSIHHHTSKAQPKTGGNLFAAAREAGHDIDYTTVSDGLPVEFDRSLNHDQFMASLLHVFSAHVDELVGKLVKSSESTAPVTCLIADTFFVWPGQVAKKYDLLYVSFWTEPALVYSLYYHVDLLRKNGHFACHDVREDDIDYIPGVKSIDPRDMMSYLQDANITTVCHQIIFNAFKDVRESHYVLCNTVEEIESETIAPLHAKIPFYAIGPLFPNRFNKSIVATSLWSESDCSQWLNTKPQGSVLYVSFGSYAHVSKRDLIEIAEGLELSKVNFVWVLRPDIVSSEDTDPLPFGFKERTSDRGIIIQWCCQKSVLAHPAIGGFLTHCGWNSTLESIWCGVPLLCFPLLTDQFTNRKLIVDDWKVGTNLCDRKVVKKKVVSNKINHLMDVKSGDEFRKAVAKVRKTMEDALKPNGSSDQNIDTFIKDLKAGMRK
ncbi:hypothetical protein ACLB2K_026650 [Fragaria x ananassa]